MKITRNELRRIISESIPGIESYPVNFPDSLKKPGMRAICIWSQMAPGNIKLTFLQSPEFGESNFVRNFRKDLSTNDAFVEIPPGRSLKSAQIVIENLFLESNRIATPYELGINVGNILDMLRTPRPGFLPFTHIIDIEDMYDARFIGELNDDVIKSYCPSWSPSGENGDEEYFI